MGLFCLCVVRLVFYDMSMSCCASTDAFLQQQPSDQSGICVTALASMPMQYPYSQVQFPNPSSDYLVTRLAANLGAGTSPIDVYVYKDK